MDCMKTRAYRKGIFVSLLMFALFLVPMMTPGVLGADTDNDGIEDADEQTLAEKYAPILQFEKDEKFYPVSIQYHLNNSNLNQSRPGPDLVDPDPTVAEIGAEQDPDLKFYLDNRLGNVSNDAIEKDYTSKESDLGYTVYARVTLESYKSKSYYVIQYWMFYAYNKGPLNTHEGDWEVVQIVLDGDQKPQEAMYSQHTAGERAEWDLVEKDGNHPTVFVARGAHANYFRPYQGKFSLGNDVVGDNGEKLEPADYDLVLLGEKGNDDHTIDQNWLQYAGRWGEYGSDEDELRGKRGPYGPVFREESEIWDNPIEWGNDLNEVSTNIFYLNWFFYNFVTIFFVLAGIGLLVKIVRIYRSHKDTGIGKRIFSVLYLEKFDLKSLGNILTIIAIGFAVVSLFHPWYSISVDVDSGDFQTDGMVEVVSVSGEDGVLVNTLESGSGMVQVFAFPLPFSLIIGLSLFFLVLATVGVQKSRVLGRKYLGSGIRLALPILIILIFVSQATSLIGFLPVELEPEQEDLVDTVSETPWEGKESSEVGEYGNATVKWGLEEGGWYLLYSGALLFTGGILGMISNKEFYKPDPGSEESIKEIRQKIEGLEREIDHKKEDRDRKEMDEAYKDKKNFLK